MCPLALASPPGINFHADDLEMVMHLERMQNGDPPPANVIEELNPYTVAPWNLPEKMFYLFNSEDTKSLKAIQEGYWLPAGVRHRILTNSPTEGWKSTLEFHIEQAPIGDRNGWVMHEYKLEQEGSRLLCRLFRHGDQIPNCIGPELNGQAVGNGDLLHSILMNCFESEENDQLSQESTNTSQVVRTEHDQPAVSSNNSLNLRPYHPPEGYNFADGDYLELNDLIFSPSTSENSCTASMISDEYFDPEALLSDLETGVMTGNASNREQQHAGCRFNVSASQGSQQVVVKPPISGTLNSNNNLQGREIMGSNTTLASPKVSGPALLVNTSFDPELKLMAANPRPNMSEANRVPSNQQGGTSHHVRRESKTGRMAKLRKIYCCCFMPI